MVSSKNAVRCLTNVQTEEGPSARTRRMIPGVMAVTRMARSVGPTIRRRPRRDVPGSANRTSFPAASGRAPVSWYSQRFFSGSYAVYDMPVRQANAPALP